MTLFFTQTVALVSTIYLALTTCANQTGKNNDYEKYKLVFAQGFTDHFPVMLLSDSSNIICNTDTNKHNVGLILYQYNINPLEIDSIQKKVKKIVIGQYNTNDSCLLIVNMFETWKSYSTFELPDIIDSSLIDKDCYRKLYPIPNFIDYDPINKNSLKLDSSFIVYVIEAKSGMYDKKYKMQPFAQMPNMWENGISKGIAISKKQNIVIYWSIMW